MDKSTTITEDRLYKPSSPEGPHRRFFIETDAFRWEAHVWRCEVKETGTPVYRALSDTGHSAWGLTANEAVNDIAGIMRGKLAAAGGRARTVSLDEVRHYLDPRDAAGEEVKASGIRAGRPLLARLLGL